LGNAHLVRVPSWGLTHRLTSGSIASMNQRSAQLKLRDYVGSEEGWGNTHGREVYQALLNAVETTSGKLVFRISLSGVRRVDVSFAREAVVELAARYRGSKGFCLVDIPDADQLENWEAAASRRQQPLTVWISGKPRILGPEPSRGNKGVLEYLKQRGEATAAGIARDLRLSITNASTKLKQLLEKGYILRREETSPTGGVEYTYFMIG